MSIEPIVKFEEAPLLFRREPLCDACCVDVESDGDGHVCPRCGTFWAYDTDEDQRGTLYEEWSGATLDIEPSDPEDAWNIRPSTPKEVTP